MPDKHFTAQAISSAFSTAGLLVTNLTHEIGFTMLLSPLLFSLILNIIWMLLSRRYLKFSKRILRDYPFSVDIIKEIFSPILSFQFFTVCRHLYIFMCYWFTNINSFLANLSECFCCKNIFSDAFVVASWICFLFFTFIVEKMFRKST